MLPSRQPGPMRNAGQPATARLFLPYLPPSDPAAKFINPAYEAISRPTSRRKLQPVKPLDNSRARHRPGTECRGETALALPQIPKFPSWLSRQKVGDQWHDSPCQSATAFAPARCSRGPHLQQGHERPARKHWTDPRKTTQPQPTNQPPPTNHLNNQRAGGDTWKGEKREKKARGSSHDNTTGRPRRNFCHRPHMNQRDLRAATERQGRPGPAAGL